MFKRRDIQPALLLSVLIILVILTLSQILVVHNGPLSNNRHNIRKLHIELRELDFNLHSMMKHRVPSIELNRRLLQNQINSNKFLHILEEASKTEEMTRVNRTLLKKAGPRHLDKENFVGGVTDKFPSNNSSASVFRDLGKDNNYGSLHNHTYHKLSPVSNNLSLLQEHYSNGSKIPHIEAFAILRANKTNQESQKNAFTRVKPADIRSQSHKTSVRQKAYPQFGSILSGNQNDRNSSVKNIFHKDIAEYCPSVPPHLKGLRPVNITKASETSFKEILQQNPETELGGSWRPTNCVARHKVAIVIPYRDRQQHLQGLLHYLHPLLQIQQLDYRVFVIEQEGNDTFNKACLMNIAFVEALKIYPFQCTVFHDVDLVPEDDRNMYSCPVQPRHLSVAIDEMGYKLAYQELVGGVLNMRTEHFQRVNGYSNLYWGWGAEDDDMAYRIMQVGLKITRPPESVARYKMIKHTKRKPSDWRKRAKLLVTGPRRYQFDGLNSLNYEIVKIRKELLFTHILVNIGKPPRGFS